jgi:hypothetical protein
VSAQVDRSLSQWQRLLRNSGVWEGSFTRLSPQGELMEDISTRVTLAAYDEDQAMRQTLEYFATSGERTQTKVLEYRTLNRGILFFEDGAFSFGSLQFAPFAEFGAELGFIHGDRRLRLVQLFDSQSQLASFTLIREHRQGADRAEKPPLTVDQLLGDWQGEAITLYPDWQSPTAYATALTICREGDRLLQRLTAPDLDLASTAAIEGSILRFEQGNHPIQVLLLPDGASCNTPLTIPRGKPFLLEAGWLISNTLRQRLIRQYDDKGGWSSLTLVTEHKVSQ